MEVILTGDQIHDAYDVACCRYKYALKHYKAERNPFINHIAGALGEVAFETTLKAAGISFDPAYRDPTRDDEADVIVAGLNIDVKTRFVYGPARFPMKQKKGLGAKTDLVLWANELHNPHGWEEGDPGAKPAPKPKYATVWLFAWAPAGVILKGSTDGDFLIPEAIEPPASLFEKIRNRSH